MAQRSFVLKAAIHRCSRPTKLAHAYVARSLIFAALLGVQTENGFQPGIRPFVSVNDPRIGRTGF
jgi:hypothetical protein